MAGKDTSESLPQTITAGEDTSESQPQTSMAGEDTRESQPQTYMTYAELLQAAAANGTDSIGDEIESLASRFEALASREDPQQELRNRCAAQLLEAAVRNIGAGTATPKALLLDVGSASGRDAGAWRAHADAAGLGADWLDIVGVELLAALNEKAAAAHPSCHFITGDAAELPLDTCTVDGVHCSRLLIHSPDAAKAIDEMVRVLRPGGCGIFEEGDFATGSIMSGDARVVGVFGAANDRAVTNLANPYAARIAYTLLKARGDVENVVLESHPYTVLDMETIDPGLDHMQKQLDALVAEGTIAQADADHYHESWRNAPRVGEPLMVGIMFKISFTKK